jgi:hypothetical protein
LSVAAGELPPELWPQFDAFDTLRAGMLTAGEKAREATKMWASVGQQRLEKMYTFVQYLVADVKM